MTRPNPIITLTTDFGLGDWFVGTMKGVILGLNARANIVDITHEIPSGNIKAGAFALASSYHFFPKHAIHVVVVDPGVGSRRDGLLVQTADYFFIGPDNGVLAFALSREKVKSVHVLKNLQYALHPVSRTFHGRDIFAPAAAHVSLGAKANCFGPERPGVVNLDWPLPKTKPGVIQGEVVYLDRFGNGITNIDQTLLSRADLERVNVSVGRRKLGCLRQFYQAVPAGQALALIGSSGYLEIAVNGGSASEVLGLKEGSAVKVSL